MLNKLLKTLALLIIFAIPLAFYLFYGHKAPRHTHVPLLRHPNRIVSAPSVRAPIIPAPAIGPAAKKLPEIAIIFDDLGESLKEVGDLYSLNIPLTVSVIPGLKFSSQSAAMAARCGFSVFIHLPMEPEGAAEFRTKKYTFISSSQSSREVKSLLRYYLNSLPQAIGVNNHMGSAATADRPLMEVVMRAIKQRNLIFVDSRTSPNSVAYSTALSQGLVAGVNDGFIDAADDTKLISERLDSLTLKAAEQGKIIVIAHPRRRTFAVLKAKLPSLKTKVRFITIKDYFSN